MPLTSLANQIGIGKIPWQLQDLSYAEKISVTKVRHKCVVHVTSGRGKLSVNVIMFANPTIKVYNNILPPSRDELTEVLASVFIGPTKPTEDEFK
ncbi:hypothetical protein DFH09DRAFT_928514 [Mycena vulgaris]|nr:hypothetical protein DFH09DRAFT_928514 [Mycena vulgaris]